MRVSERCRRVMLITVPEETLLTAATPCTAGTIAGRLVAYGAAKRRRRMGCRLVAQPESLLMDRDGWHSSHRRIRVGRERVIGTGRR
jgi:hypothetical protein